MIPTWLLPHRLARTVRETRGTQTPVRWRDALLQASGRNRGAYWPVHPSSLVASVQSIIIGVETSPGFMPGCYIQGTGGIVIGDYTQIGPSVGIISSNHDPADNRAAIKKTIRIGAYCWLGMHSVILPGVQLGDFTVVGAGAIVTKSFPDGHVVLGGNPARPIRQLDPARCVRHKSAHEYHGYLASSEFPAFRELYLRLPEQTAA